MGRGRGGVGGERVPRGGEGRVQGRPARRQGAEVAQGGGGGSLTKCLQLAARLSSHLAALPSDPSRRGPAPATARTLPPSLPAGCAATATGAGWVKGWLCPTMEGNAGAACKRGQAWGSQGHTLAPPMHRSIPPIAHLHLPRWRPTSGACCTRTRRTPRRTGPSLVSWTVRLQALPHAN